MLGWGILGFTGFTPAHYAALSDRQIVGLLTAPRGEDGAVIPERALLGTGTGDPRLFRREMPSVESLGVPSEVLMQGVPQQYVALFWDVWSSRGTPAGKILDLWNKHLTIYRPRQMTG